MMGQSSREDYLKTVATVCELFNYVALKINSVRRHRDGTLLDELVHVHEKTGDEPLTLEELLSMFQVFLLGGQDTTRQTLASGMQLLATDPSLLRQLQEHPEQVPAFIEEVIRVYSPANVTARLTTVDTELAGVAIPKGSTVFVCWGSANRDADAFAQPDTFQCPNTAVGAEHFAFGAGVHFCVGNRLARTTTAIAFNAIVSRYKSIELAVPESELRYMPSIHLRALVSLPLRCTLNGD
jgi:cytochrome P450